MGRRRRARMKNGLPRGGLGRVGWIAALGSFAATWFVASPLAVGVSLLVLPICVWCALGLRKDHDTGEVSDEYVDDDSVDWKELLSGNFQFKVRRESNGMIALGVLACVLALCRWRFGWGPFA